MKLTILVVPVAHGIVVIMLVINVQSVQESIPDKSVSSASMERIKFGVVVEFNTLATRVFPPNSTVILDGINSEETSTNIIAACALESVTNASQTSNRNQTLEWSFAVVISNASMNSFHESQFFISFPIIKSIYRYLDTCFTPPKLTCSKCYIETPGFQSSPCVCIST